MSQQTLPDSRGYFGAYGGRFVPEVLIPAIEELEAAFRQALQDAAFQEEFASLSRHYSGRPTPLYFAERLTRQCGGARILLKREDLAHTGAHKINNALGQALLAKRMGKRRIIAETGAGQHGVAVAAVCAMMGMKCIVYMGEEDIHRQSLFHGPVNTVLDAEENDQPRQRQDDQPDPKAKTDALLHKPPPSTEVFPILPQRPRPRKGRNAPCAIPIHCPKPRSCKYTKLVL